MRMPEPRLRRLFSLGGVSPKKRIKNSSRGSLEPERGKRCEAVEMLTTTGMVFLAITAKEGGRAPSSAARLAARAGASDDERDKNPRPMASAGRAALALRKHIRVSRHFPPDSTTRSD